MINGLMGKSTFPMAIFDSYVKLPEGPKGQFGPFMDDLAIVLQNQAIEERNRSIFATKGGIPRESG